MNGTWSYQAVKETGYNPELGEYCTYGIRACKITAGSWEQVDLFHDVTVSPSLAEQLAERFSLYQLSPIHLKDVIEDTLP